MRPPNDALMERLLFNNPIMYRFKYFMIQTVIWKWILSGVLRMKPSPMPDLSDLYQGKRILVGACGPGDVSTGPALDAAGNVTAFDISQEFVDTCKINRPSWTVFCDDILKISQSNDSFDIVVIYSALHHIPANAEKVLAELARVSRDRIVIVEGLIPKRGVLRLALLCWYRVVDGGVHYYTREELTAIFDKLGLDVERTTAHSPIKHMVLFVLRKKK